MEQNLKHQQKIFPSCNFQFPRVDYISFVYTIEQKPLQQWSVFTPYISGGYKLHECPKPENVQTRKLPPIERYQNSSVSRNASSYGDERNYSIPC